MLNTESKWNPNPTYMSNQVKIEETIRSTLVDWLIQIHYNFKLLPETLFLTVNVIDRYFSKHQITKREVQLVGISALLIVTKYEEIYPPILKDFIYITENEYTAEDILDMEKKILFALDFDINLCSSFRFLERFNKLGKICNVTFFLSQYMLELGLLDSKMSQFDQSIQALAAIYTAKKYMQLHNPSSSESAQFVLGDYGVKWSLDQVKSCANCFNQLAKLIYRSKLQNIVKKFSNSQYFKVAKMVSQSQQTKKSY